MTPDTLSRLVALYRGDVLRIRDGRGITVRPTSGVLWVTEEKCPGDAIIAPGDVCRLEGNGLALVYAHHASRVVIDVPATVARMPDVRLALHGSDDARVIRFAPPRRRGLAATLRALGMRALRAYRRPQPTEAPVGGYHAHDMFLSSRRVRGVAAPRTVTPGGPFDRHLIPYY